MFKVGQKVVYIGDSKESLGNYPERNEIVTVKSMCIVYSGSVDILEYPINKLNNPQSFKPYLFRPLDETFAESVLENIKEQIKEQQLILV